MSDVNPTLRTTDGTQIAPPTFTSRVYDEKTGQRLDKMLDGFGVTVEEIPIKGLFTFADYTDTIYKYGRLCVLPFVHSVSRYPSEQTDKLPEFPNTAYLVYKLPEEVKPLCGTPINVQANKAGTPRNLFWGYVHQDGFINCVPSGSYASGDSLRGTAIWLTAK